MTGITLVLIVKDLTGTGVAFDMVGGNRYQPMPAEDGNYAG